MARFAWIALLSFPGLVASISMASSSRRRKLLELDDLRRSLPRASQSAVQGLVAYLKKNGLPELYNRNDQREARDMKVTDKTAYGPIAQYLDLKPADPAGDNVPLLMAHPLAMIWKAYRECDAFAAFLDARLVAQPCTPDTPWKMILYGDEVHPGDVLGGNKARKFQAVYYSFLEFGLVALSYESLWFTLTTTRSSFIKAAADAAKGATTEGGGAPKGPHMKRPAANKGTPLKNLSELAYSCIRKRPAGMFKRPAGAAPSCPEYDDATPTPYNGGVIYNPPTFGGFRCIREAGNYNSEKQIRWHGDIEEAWENALQAIDVARAEGTKFKPEKKR